MKSELTAVAESKYHLALLHKDCAGIAYGDIYQRNSDHSAYNCDGVPEPNSEKIGSWATLKVFNWDGAISLQSFSLSESVEGVIDRAFPEIGRFIGDLEKSILAKQVGKRDVPSDVKTKDEEAESKPSHSFESLTPPLLDQGELIHLGPAVSTPENKNEVEPSIDTLRSYLSDLKACGQDVTFRDQALDHLDKLSITFHDYSAKFLDSIRFDAMGEIACRDEFGDLEILKSRFQTNSNSE